MPIPTRCDGLEQEAFEAFLERSKMSLETHPLHWLFMHPESNAARQGWCAAIEYAQEQTTDLRWRPIEELDNRYLPGLLLYSASLIDEDFNPDGIVEGHWQDGICEEEGEWVAAVWCDYHDTFETKVVKPTHYMVKPKFEVPK